LYRRDRIAGQKDGATSTMTEEQSMASTEPVSAPWTSLPRALTDNEAAQYLGLKVSTLRAWRLKDRGPRYVRLGTAIRYLVADLDAYTAKNTVSPLLGLFAFGSVR
jgi:excisionase family DNA binding protein